MVAILLLAETMKTHGSVSRMALVERNVLGEIFVVFAWFQNFKLNCLSLDIKDGSFSFAAKPSTTYRHLWTYGFTDFKGLPFITGGYSGGSSSEGGLKTEIFNFDEEQWFLSYDYLFASKM